MQHIPYDKSGDIIGREYPDLDLPDFDPASDQLVYHYTTAEIAHQFILRDGTLRLNPYRVMRDPLENKELPLMLRYATHTDTERLPLRRVQELVTDLRGQMRIVSLTMDATDYEDQRLRAFGCGYARPRMWEHYAQKHTGICLAFSARCLVEDFFRELQTYGAPTCGPVKYTEGGFVVSEGRVVDGEGLTEANAAERLARHIVDHHEDFWYLKLLDWETEYEYRFVLFSPTHPEREPIDVPFGACLRAVILGEKFNQDLEPDIRSLAEVLNARAFRLEWTSGRPVPVPSS